ncbi:MAG: tetratricopeptide repeat-containing sulfotransferase family protein [Bacillota bacterium]
MAATSIPNAAIRALIAQAVRHQQQGQYAEAERLYADALQQDPDLPDAHHFMGLLAHQTGRQELAESHMHRALALAPRRAEFRYNYANMLLGLGRPQDAAQQFQQAVDIDPRMADAWLGLGMVLHSLQHHMHAIACFRNALELNARSKTAWQELGECFQALSMFPEALEAYRSASNAAPEDPRLLLAVATVLMEMRRDSEAEETFRRLLAMAPNLPEIHYQHGVYLSNRGDFTAARAALERALELAPDFYQAALYYAYITSLKPDVPLVQRLINKVKQGGWTEPGQAVNLHFTLGYVLEKNQQYDAAFEHFQEANRQQRPLGDYSTAMQRKLQASMQEAFGPDFQERARNFANPSSKPLFIIGMPRSGTSLLEQILASHPLVYGGGEMTYLHAELRRRIGLKLRDDFAAAVIALPDMELAAAASRFLSHLDELAPDARHVTDKMPSNFMLLGLLHALFPNARIVHCQRDPMDTCVSCFTTSFRHGHKFSNDLRELGEYYRLYEESMAYWQRTLPAGSIHGITYESLVQNLESEVRRLLEFCGLPWDEACLRFQDNARAVSTASMFQVRQPVYASAIGRWRRYARHLEPLKQALGERPLL